MKQITLSTLKRQWAYQTLRYKNHILESILESEGDMWEKIASKMKIEIIPKRIYKRKK